MPLPRPKREEDEESFLTRCMSDEVMIDEFGKLEQRFAVCEIQWETFEDEMEEDDELEDIEEESGNIEEEIDDNELIFMINQIKKVTNFPQHGDDETVSLTNSKYELFPLEFAERIKEKYPKVWSLGGNILGNEQYRHLYDIRKNKIPTDQLTPRQNEAIRLREAWSARHYENLRPAGVIAQMKWHTVGSRGLEYMKNLMNEEIKKRYGDDA
jgi:hypothetical protein